MSRQNFYRARKGRSRQDVDERFVVKLVRAERQLQPRLGCRKLYVLLKEPLNDAGIKLGRDRFFKVLSKNGLLVEPLPRGPITTMSNHSLPLFPNRLKDLELVRAHQAWVTDITYIRTEGGVKFLVKKLRWFSCRLA